MSQQIQFTNKVQQVAFKKDRRGQDLAYLWCNVGNGGTWKRIPLDEGNRLIAYGAKEVSFDPF